MTDNRKNIKIDESLFNRLKDAKGDRRSWPQFFEDELLGDDADDADPVTLEATEVERIAIEIEQRLG
jgi:hypothetical protein